MKNKMDFEDKMRSELSKEYSSPSGLNLKLMNRVRKEPSYELVNKMLVLLLLVESILTVSTGVLVVSNIYLKVFVILSGLSIWNFTLLIFALIKNKEVY